MSFCLLSLLACLVVGAYAAELGSHGLLAEVWLDTSGEYVAQLNIGSPPQPTLLLLDLAENYIWVHCSELGDSFSPSHSATFRNVSHGGAPVFVNIPGSTLAQKEVESFTFNITDGANPGLQDVEVQNVKFFCSSASPLSQVAKGVVGMGRGKLSLPSEIAAHLNLPRRFAYCLSGVTQLPTPLLLSSSNYTLMPELPITLRYTALMKPRKEKPGYRVGLQAIQVAETTLHLNPKLFRGGLEISTREPYTKLVTPAYEALRDAFREIENGVQRVAPVAPFDTCYNSSMLGSTRIGPSVNSVTFVFTDNTSWPFFGDSSMVQVSEDVLCFGFLDAGPLPAHSILGAHQQQDSFVEIDLDKNQLGFTATLLGIRTNCANFNFTRSDI